MTEGRAGLECAAARLAVLTLVCAVLCALVVVVAVAGGYDGSHLAIVADGPSVGGRPAKIETALSGGLAVAFLLCLRGALGTIAAGDTFGKRMRGQLNVAALLLLAAACVDVVASALSGPSGDASGLTLSMSGSDALLAMCAGAFHFASRLLGRAEEYRFDSERIV